MPDKKTDVEEKIQETAEFLNRKVAKGINTFYGIFVFVIFIVAVIFAVFGKIGASQPPNESGVDTIFSPGFIRCILGGILGGLPFILIGFVFLHILRISIFKFGVFGCFLLIGLLFLLFYFGALFHF